jgi:RNA polymerase sigma-70 factor, ECF subfamily
MKPDEQRMLSGARCFDSQALAEIYDTYSPALYAYALRLLGDSSLAEECVSDTFCRFLQSLRLRSGPDYYLKAYLYRIAHNWITDSYRRQPPPPIELNEDILAAGEDEPSQAVLFKVQQQQLRAALIRLTPEQRQVLVLKYWEDMDNALIANSIQKPVGAVKALQHRAINTLRRLLSLSHEVAE